MSFRPVSVLTSISYCSAWQFIYLLPSTICLRKLSSVLREEADPLSRAKMRLASSGPFHNLLTYGWLALLAFSGTGNLLWSDRSDVGRIVQTVSEVRITCTQA